MPESHTATQRDLNRLEKGSERNFMKFNSVPVHAGGHPLGKQLGREEPGDPGGHQVKYKPVKYLVGEEILGCINQIAAIRLREVNPACYSAVESPYLEYFPSSMLPRGKKDMNILEAVQ